MTLYLVNDFNIILFTVLAGFVLVLDIWTENNESLSGMVVESKNKHRNYKFLFYLLLGISFALELCKLWIY